MGAKFAALQHGAVVTLSGVEWLLLSPTMVAISSQVSLNKLGYCAIKMPVTIKEDRLTVTRLHTLRFAIRSLGGPLIHVLYEADLLFDNDQITA